MNEWQQWLKEREARSPIDNMHLQHGKHTDPSTCNTCAFYSYRRRSGGAAYYTETRCGQYPAKVNWRAEYLACGLYKDKVKGKRK